MLPKYLPTTFFQSAIRFFKQSIQSLFESLMILLVDLIAVREMSLIAEENFLRKIAFAFIMYFTRNIFEILRFPNPFFNRALLF